MSYVGLPASWSTRVDTETLNTEPDVSSLKGQTVLVTGGASGLGAAVSRRFAEAGAQVTIAAINEELGEKLAAELQAQGLRVQFVQTDVTSWESQTNAFKSVVKHSPSGKALDVVVAAAGVVSGPLILPGEEPPGLENGPLEPQIGPLMVNTVGVLYTTQLARYYLRLPSPSNETSTSTKALILFGSTACYFGAPMAATYNASKHGARGLFHSVREPLAKQGVRINMMCPWIMPTPMTTGWILTFTEAGLPISKVEDVVIAVTRCAVDESICGRSIVNGPRRNIDLCDDEEGQYGTRQLQQYFAEEMPGYNEKMGKVMSTLTRLA
ncbi:hypothetical protein MMC28_006350 [Mycoblastus sanguinarius]|nr:hypothetical protein [Mycoblastus sanguinarius]